MAKSILYYGDNLDVLRTHVKDDSIDLIYLDPPFNSKRDYNVLFQERDEKDSEAQIRAFGDYWKWDRNAAQTYRDLVDEEAEDRGVPTKLVALMESLHGFLGENDMMAYLAMMAIRTVELRRVLKPTGSLYLHCDPTSSHYLKLILDAVFGPERFVNEIIWRRTGSHKPSRSFGPIHDSILFYSKTDAYYFKPVKRPYSRQHVQGRYTPDATGRLKFTSGGNVLSGAGKTKGESGATWRGFDPSAKGRHWAVPGFLTEQMPEGFSDLGVLAKLEALYAAKLIDIVPGTAWPTPVRYLGSDDGNPTGDIWAYQPGTDNTLHGTDKGIDHDVAWLGPTDPERLGYQTQKPVGLVERIISASCPEEGTVLDPFCGCGTAVHAAQKMGRPWVGIDITHLAISLIRSRLDAAFPALKYGVRGEPSDVESARVLAEQDAYQFQWWALHMIGARPVGDGTGREGKKGSDKGIDGVIRFRDDPAADKSQRIIVSVKAGRNLAPAMVRDLRGTIERDKAPIGVLLTMHEPSPQMRAEAAKAGPWKSPTWQREYPKIQILTVAEAFAGKRVEYPGQDMTQQTAEAEPEQPPKRQAKGASKRRQ